MLALGWLGGPGGGPRERAGPAPPPPGRPPGRSGPPAPGGWGVAAVERGPGWELALWSEGPLLERGPAEDAGADAEERARAGAGGAGPLLACLGWDACRVLARGREVRWELGGSPGRSLLAEPVAAVACGEAHALACTAGGRVLAWGRAAEGQLGLSEERGAASPARAAVPEPVSLPGRGTTAVGIACGARHSLAVTSDGRAFLWGWSLHGQAGAANVSCVWSPRLLEGLPAGAHVAGGAAGIGHTCLWTRAGDVWALGWDVDAQLGRGEVGRAEAEPQLVRGGLGGREVAKVSCGARHSVALTREGRAFGWGWDGRGQLLGDAGGRGKDAGRGATGGGGSTVASPVELRPGRYFREVACGWWHTLLVVDPTPPCRGAAGECAPAPLLDVEK